MKGATASRIRGCRSNLRAGLSSVWRESPALGYTTLSSRIGTRRALSAYSGYTTHHRHKGGPLEQAHRCYLSSMPTKCDGGWVDSLDKALDHTLVLRCTPEQTEDSCVTKNTTSKYDTDITNCDSVISKAFFLVAFSVEK